MFKVNGQPSAEKIEAYDNDRYTWYRWQNPSYEIEGEYTQSWGMVFASAEEARESAEDWGLTEDEAVLPGKSCMPEFSQIIRWATEFSNNDVLLVFKGYDTFATGHDGEYVADYEAAIEVWSMQDVINYANRKEG